jgi:hypothetical protein
MKTWNAFQIGQSNGAYAGHVVKFRNVKGEQVHGVLKQSFHPQGSPNVLLTVACDQSTDVHTVGSYEMVEVH